MKKNDFLLTVVLFFIGFSYAAANNCDSCSVTADFSILNDTNSCDLIIDDLSFTDSCNTFLYSIVDYGNGITDTIYPGQNIYDVYTTGTYNFCLTAYAINYDSLGQYTICSDTLCTMVTKDSCCGPCTIIPDFEVHPGGNCELIFNELTSTDSCTTHLYSVIEYGDGTIDTIYPGDVIDDPYSQGTYDFCLTAYGVSYDAQGNPIYCDSTKCEEVIKHLCHNPWRKKYIEEEIATFNYYPNPTNGLVNITFGNNNIERIRILSISGKVVDEQIITEQEKYVTDLTRLPEGVYLIELKTSEKLITKKIIKY
jgi:hypothetical protein